MALYIGLMSGTSLDGVDGVLVELSPGHAPGVRGHRHEPFVGALRDALMALNLPGDDEIDRAARAAQGVALAYSSVVSALLFDCGHSASDVVAIGAHGQTVRHRPDARYTVQLLDGALLAELTRIDVVCDFRSRDVAAGGQGAPLAPGFHAAMFAHPAEARAVLNLGGIANVTLLRPDAPVLGFDTGPANALMDAWCARHRGEAFDADGAWAASGRVIEPLLAALLAEPFFGLPPPKSTGRDLFHLDWLAPRLDPAWAPVDVQATLAALTAQSVADALQHHGPDVARLLVCGGGARNAHLMGELARRLPGQTVGSTAEFGLPVDQVEAVAFAWLAQRFVDGAPGNLPEVTGARGARRLGCLHPA